MQCSCLQYQIQTCVDSEIDNKVCLCLNNCLFCGVIAQCTCMLYIYIIMYYTCTAETFQGFIFVM